MILLIVICTITVPAARAQTEWSKYEGNPVMVKDTTLNGVWEWAGIGQPSCLFEHDTFKMWYAAAGVAYLGDTILRGRIGYAFSINGSTWVKHEPLEPVLDVGDSTAWDSRWCDTPAPLNDGIEYKLYYYGDSQSVVFSAIGVATSPDGVSFTRYGNAPILERSPEIMDWDGFWVESPAVLYDSSTGIYSMWYTGIGYGPGHPGDTWIRIGYASSYDGFTWHKDTINNPVLETGEPGSWDDGWVAVPAVRWENGQYEMWYCGASIADWLPDSSLDTGRVGYATSPDGITWEKYSGNPILTTFDPPVDSGGPWAPDVVCDGYGYHMWYEARSGMHYAIAPSSGNKTPVRTDGISALYIRPNPCRYCCTIIAAEPLYSVILYDITGRCIKEVIPGIPSCRVCLDMERMPSGVYFICAQASRAKAVKKIVIHH
jgi:hypothetical protein